MKYLALILLCSFVTLPSYARCIVEIFDRNGDPLGHIFQDRTCANAMARCKAQLSRLNSPGAKCEITLDIPGALPSDITDLDDNY
jgi:hypothetical protein